MRPPTSRSRRPAAQAVSPTRGSQHRQSRRDDPIPNLLVSYQFNTLISRHFLSLLSAIYVWFHPSRRQPLPGTEELWQGHIQPLGKTRQKNHGAVAPVLFLAWLTRKPTMLSHGSAVAVRDGIGPTRHVGHPCFDRTMIRRHAVYGHRSDSH